MSAPVNHRTADALADAVELLEEFLPADHAALVRIQDALAAENVALLATRQPTPAVRNDGDL